MSDKPLKQKVYTKDFMDFELNTRKLIFLDFQRIESVQDMHPPEANAPDGTVSITMESGKQYSIKGTTRTIFEDRPVRKMIVGTQVIEGMPE